MTQLIGILNLTPDSFSDGGKYDAPHKAYQQAERLINDGAEVLDIGAESTRPNATPIDTETEWKRLEVALPDIITLAHERGIKVSIDTRHAETAARAIRAGVDWINDVSFGTSDRLLCEVAASSVEYVAMHSLGVPANKHVILSEESAAYPQVSAAFVALLSRLENFNIEHSRVILDAGIGFGKNAQQSLSLLWDTPKFTELGCRLLVGHSRKSCFKLLDDDVDALTIAASAYLMHCDVDYLRVHDVRTHATVRKRLMSSFGTESRLL
jgi:dihydropteroate synthase